MKYEYVAIIRDPSKPNDKRAYTQERREIEANDKHQARYLALLDKNVVNIYRLRLKQQ